MTRFLGMALGPVASLGLAFSLGFPTSPSLHLVKAGGGSHVEASHSAPPHTHISPFWGEGCKAGTHGLLEIIKIYASVCEHTFKSWRFPSTLVYLNSRASWISSLLVVCLCHRQAANGRASRRCALCISLLPPPHTEGSVRPRNTTPSLPPPLPPSHSLRPGAARLLTHWRRRDEGLGGGVEGRAEWAWRGNGSR